MKRIPQDPSPVSFSLSLYETLLKTYPSGFRHEYGPHMEQVFRDCCLRTYRLSGLPGLMSLWTHTLLDYFKSVVEEHIQKGVHMSKLKFIRLSGWSFILGAIAFMVTILVSLRDVPEYNPYNAASRPIDLYFEYAQSILFPAAILLLLVGMVGLYLRYNQETNEFGRFSLILGMVGGAISTLIILAASLQLELAESVGGLLWIIGLPLYFLGLVTFGIAAIQGDLLPRWNGVPIMAGIGFLLMLLLSASSGGWEISDIILIGGMTLTSLGLIVLGVILGSDSREMVATS
jgi:uncharacterized membrane protein